MEGALKEAMKTARHPAAASLPGFIRGKKV
jgi:hypothetical protein